MDALRPNRLDLTAGTKTDMFDFTNNLQEVKWK